MGRKEDGGGKRREVGREGKRQKERRYRKREDETKTERTLWRKGGIRKRRTQTPSGKIPTQQLSRREEGDPHITVLHG